MSVQIRIFVPSFDRFHALLLEWTVRTIRATNKYIHSDSLKPFLVLKPTNEVQIQKFFHVKSGSIFTTYLPLEIQYTSLNRCLSAAIISSTEIQVILILLRYAV